MVQLALLITGLFATVSFASAIPPSVSPSLDLPKWSTKYPGKLYNSLAEASTNVEYSVVNSTKIRARSNYYLSCDGPSVVQNAQCDSTVTCDADGYMDISGSQFRSDALYCLSHCICDGSDDESSDDEPEVQTPTPPVCGTTYCKENHSWCLVDGANDGCGDVTVTRAAAGFQNAVSGRLTMHQDTGTASDLRFQMSINDETSRTQLQDGYTKAAC